jgi:hypothetical protein
VNLDQTSAPIEPTRIYSSAEVRKIIYGRVKIQRLRDHGLRSAGCGYLGQDLLDAWEACCESRRSPGGTNSKRKTDHEGNPQSGKHPHRRVDSPKQITNPLESNRSSRTVYAPRTPRRPLEVDLREQFQKLAKEVDP